MFKHKLKNNIRAVLFREYCNDYDTLRGCFFCRPVIYFTVFATAACGLWCGFEKYPNSIRQIIVIAKPSAVVRPAKPESPPPKNNTPDTWSLPTPQNRHDLLLICKKYVIGAVVDGEKQLIDITKLDGYWAEENKLTDWLQKRTLQSKIFCFRDFDEFISWLRGRATTYVEVDVSDINQ